MDRASDLFCARDAMGVKPFFYFDSPQVFAFASEIKGLFCLPQVSRAPSDTQIAGYLTIASAIQRCRSTRPCGGCCRGIA